MISTLKTMLVKWNSRHTERDKLQHTYIVVSVCGVIIAGLVGLLNYDASRTILRICFIGLGIFLVNAITWALLYSLVITKLSARAVPTNRK
ncbi:MAG TPA: hypothetical protein VLE73_04280 [Candidatus Saccharimonadales bacterium]|nr:hypothetical protein [Candidatus Saccharimonadales bacterium]